MSSIVCNVFVTALTEDVTDSRMVLAGTGVDKPQAY